jgi:hypothetical protein
MQIIIGSLQQAVTLQLLIHSKTEEETSFSSTVVFRLAPQIKNGFQNSLSQCQQ